MYVTNKQTIKQINNHTMLNIDHIAELAKAYKKEFEENRPILLKADYCKNHIDWTNWCIKLLPKTYEGFSKSWLSEWSNEEEMNLTFGAMLRSNYLKNYFEWLVYEKRFLTLNELDAIVHNVRLCNIKPTFEEARDYVLSFLGGCKYYNEGKLWNV